MNDDQTTEHFDIVMENPAIYYHHPAEIVTDPRLTKAERLKLLDEWNIDISQKLSADEEGMTPARARDSADDAVIMEDIAHAKAAVENAEEANEGILAAIQRLWHRL
jgi:hypothetical protein